jgi:hypothetical protein
MGKLFDPIYDADFGFRSGISNKPLAFILITGVKLHN